MLAIIAVPTMSLPFLSLLRGADHWLFHEVNQVWTLPILDRTMPVITDFLRPALVRYGLLPAALAYWFYVRGRQAAKAMLALALVLSLTDAVCHRLVKPYFHRSRPEKAGVQTVLRTNPHYGFSFPSNHAANCFAGASFLSMIEPPIAPWAFAIAGIVAYSRVYVGVHFPLDVAGGAFLGLAIGGLAGWAFRRLSRL